MIFRFIRQVVAVTFCLAMMGQQRAHCVEEEPEGWQREIAFGVNRTTGNSATLMTNARLDAEHERDKNSWDMGAEGSYGETEGETTSDNAKAAVQYDHELTRKYYASGRASVEYDGAADLHYRWIMGPAAGFYLLRKDSFFLKSEVGPSYVTEELGPRRSSYYALRVSQKLEKSWADDSKVWQSIEYIPDIHYGTNYLLNTEVGLDAAVNSHFGLQITLQHKYNSEPAEDKTAHDLALISSLSYKF